MTEATSDEIETSNPKSPRDDLGSDASEEASVFSPEPTPRDSRAEAEAAALAEGEDLRKDGARREHKRHQSFREHINRAALVVFWAVIVCLLWALAAYTWHMLMPSDWHYLSAEQLESLKTVLGAALFSSALSGYVGKRMQG